MLVWNVLHVARWKYRIQKIAVWAPLHNFVGLYLHNEGTYRQSEKNLLGSDISSTSPQYGELRPTSSWDHFVNLGHPWKIQRVSRLGSITARHSSIGHQPNFAAMNRGRHLYSAGRPSRWALAHISSLHLHYCVGGIAIDEDYHYSITLCMANVDLIQLLTHNRLPYLHLPVYLRQFLKLRWKANRFHHHHSRLVPTRCLACGIQRCCTAIMVHHKWLMEAATDSRLSLLMVDFHRFTQAMQSAIDSRHHHSVQRRLRRQAIGHFSVHTSQRQPDTSTQMTRSLKRLRTYSRPTLQDFTRVWIASVWEWSHSAVDWPTPRPETSSMVTAFSFYIRRGISQMEVIGFIRFLPTLATTALRVVFS